MFNGGQYDEYGGNNGDQSLEEMEAKQREVEVEIMKHLSPIRQFIVDIEQFKNVKSIGKGGYGEVYLSMHKTSGKKCAVKLLTLETMDAQQLLYFCREVMILASAHNKFLLPFFGFSPNPPYIIVTEYISRGTLFDALRHKTSSPLLTATHKTIIALGVTRGMMYLHSQQIIHRDLKSLNILLDDDLTPRICDFGIARFLSEQTSTVTQKLGTPHWMAPELFESDHYTHKVDVYAFGILLWEMLTESIPFRGKDGFQVAIAVTKNGERPKFPPNVTPEMSELISACWDQNPESRPEFSTIFEYMTQKQMYYPGTNPEKVAEFVRKYTGSAEVQYLQPLDAPPQPANKQNPVQPQAPFQPQAQQQEIKPPPPIQAPIQPPPQVQPPPPPINVPQQPVQADVQPSPVHQNEQPKPWYLEPPASVMPNQYDFHQGQNQLQQKPLAQAPLSIMPMGAQVQRNYVAPQSVMPQANMNFIDGTPNNQNPFLMVQKSEAKAKPVPLIKALFIDTMSKLTPENAKEKFASLISVFDKNTPRSILLTALNDLSDLIVKEPGYIPDFVSSGLYEALPIHLSAFSRPVMKIVIAVVGKIPEKINLKLVQNIFQQFNDSPKLILQFFHEIGKTYPNINDSKEIIDEFVKYSQIFLAPSTVTKVLPVLYWDFYVKDNSIEDQVVTICTSYLNFDNYPELIRNCYRTLSLVTFTSKRPLPIAKVIHHITHGICVNDAVGFICKLAKPPPSRRLVQALFSAYDRTKLSFCALMNLSMTFEGAKIILGQLDLSKIPSLDAFTLLLALTSHYGLRRAVTEVECIPDILNQIIRTRDVSLITTSVSFIRRLSITPAFVSSLISSGFYQSFVQMTFPSKDSDLINTALLLFDTLIRNSFTPDLLIALPYLPAILTGDPETATLCLYTLLVLSYNPDTHQKIIAANILPAVTAMKLNQQEHEYRTAFLSQFKDRRGS